MSKRETIIQAIMTRLSSTAGVSGRVFRSREDALAAIESPSVVVGPENEEVQELTNGLVECYLTVAVGVFQRGTEPDRLADPVLESVHGLLLSDATLGGLCIDLVDQGTQFEFAEGDETAAMVSTRYRVWYRRSRSSMAA